MVSIIVNPVLQDTVSAALLEQYCILALECMSVTAADLTVVVDGDALIQDMNKQYRGIDAPTDVLSFSLDYADPETGRHYLGDIIISADTAARNAQSQGGSLMDEIRLLLVHGVLHLLGYDHASLPEEKAMWAKQAEIIDHIGNSLSGG